MKKVVAFLSAFFLGLVYFTSPFSAYAFAPGNYYPSVDSPSDLGVILDIVDALAGGAELDFSSYDDPLTALGDYKSKKLYGTSSFYELTGAYLDGDYFRFAKSNIKENALISYNNYQLSNDETALKMRFDGDIFCDWSNMNRKWYKNYVDSLSSEIDIITPALPEAYSYFSNQIYLWTRNYRYLGDNNDLFYENVQWNTTNYENPILFNKYSVSYFMSNGAIPHSNPGQNGPITDSLYITGSVANIYIDTSDFSVVYDLSFPNRQISANRYGNFMTIQKSWNGVIEYIKINSAQSAGSPSLTTSFNSLGDAVAYIYNHFANVNLIVDGVYWTYVEAGNIPSSIIVKEPTTVNPNSNNGTTTYKINLPKNVDAAIVDCPAVIQTIADSITEGNALTFSDLVDAGALQDEQGNVLSSTDFKEVPIDQVLAGSYFGIGLSDLPNLPLSSSGVGNGFAGVSILAEIVDATQLSLPSSLVTVFWGVFFILILVGLILLLHR